MSQPEASPTNSTLRQARRLVVFVIGVTICAFGVALLVLPGPGVLVVVLGFSILASEFAWARHLLKRAKQAAGLEPPDESDSERA